MRLDELTRPYNHLHAHAVLRQAGYRPIGVEGTFGTVWAKDGRNTVIKIFTMKDEAYIDFVKLVFKHRDNPHFPRFNGKLLRVTNLYMGIRMERLETNSYASNLGDKIVIEKYLDFKGNMARMTADQQQRAEILFNAQPRLREACDLIIEHLGEDHDMDAHLDNVMMRGDTYVLTDPVAY